MTEYEYWHKSENGCPEVKASITGAGIANMEIYRTGNRLFMIMDTSDDFDFARKAVTDAANPIIQEW
ncbi:L-rhamnose mutarotase [uncultured Mucilaginibacter sp.]|uniref:L-rhamnose mutarotase n=1 Tax=uncultured Mucilaginibacter sp. TaxID=797541 RepID=UPI0025F82588|nr:L-rhamnose mutarotase [uncultured Mucilaginibacter sp.]